jgi:hypothetical protein
MNLKEFAETIKYALSFIEFAPQDKDIQMVFEIVDADKDGFISYEEYFRFLKEYFGSKSVAAKLVHKISVIEEVKNSRGGEKEMNIIKKYSKYDGMENLIGIQKPAGSNNNTTSINGSMVEDKKPKQPTNPKIEITLSNRSNKK